MEELNEFFVRADDAAIALIKNSRELHALDPNTGEVDQEWTDSLQHSEGLRWGKVQELYVVGMIVGVLFAFVERSLRWLCQRLCPEDSQFSDRKIRGAKLEGYIDFLRSDCGLSFDVPREFLEAVRVVRPLRNKFVHGSWDDFAEEIGEIDLSRVLRAVTSLFLVIEQASERPKTSGP